VSGKALASGFLADLEPVASAITLSNFFADFKRPEELSMTPIQQYVQQTRRDFLTTASSGLGLAALSAMLDADGTFAPASAVADDQPVAVSNPLAVRPPHFAPKAKNCIFLFQAGAPSHLDLFDPKPKLNELDGQPLPKEMLDKVRFAFIKKDSAVLLGSPRTWSKHGQCGMDFSDFLPHLATCADDLLMIRSLHSEQFNHHPGQLLLSCGRATFGLPTMGSWLTYGLGSVSQDLPGYVVLTSGRGSSGGASLWSSGFLPSHYAGVLFRNEGEAVLNLANPAGLPPELQRRGPGLAQVAEREPVGRDRRSGDRQPHCQLRIGLPDAVGCPGVDRRERRDRRHVGRLRSRPAAASAGHGPRQRGQRASLVRAKLSVGSPHGGTRRAVRQHHLRSVGPAQQPGRRPALQHVGSRSTDRGVAQRLKQRGLLDSTLVVWGAEFGRTPLGENRNGRDANTGRDHHPFSFTLWMAGGGVRGGQVYGETDEIGWGVTRDPVHINDFHATLLHLFGLDHLRLTHRFQGRDFRLTDVGGKVIDRWLA
jgi:hypothetical protein